MTTLTTNVYMGLVCHTNDNNLPNIWEEQNISDAYPQVTLVYDTIRYDTRCYFNVRSKDDMSQLNLPHGNNN